MGLGNITKEQMNNIETLLNEAKALNNTMKIISEKFHQLESGLQEMNCNFPFKIDINEKVDGIDYYAMSWERNDEGKSKVFRIFLLYMSEGGLVESKKALLQANLNLRLSMLKHLDRFAKEYALFLENKNEELIQKV